MENKKSLFAALVLSLTVFGTAHAAPPPSGTFKEVLITVNGAFVPDGQAANEETFVTPIGLFPNTCYSWSRAEVRNLTNFDHEIRSYAWVDQVNMCLMYLRQITDEKVSLGRLQPGVHRIRFISHDDTFLEKKLVVR